MSSRLILKLAALGGMMLAVFVLLALAPGVRTRAATATPPAPVSLLSCPNMDASSTGKVTSADILAVVRHYGKSYGQSGYSYLYDPIAPYNPASPPGTGKVTSSDISYVVHKYGQFCPLLDTQIARATLAIGDPMYLDILCDDAGAIKYTIAVNCGGDPRFLTENASFLLSRGYVTTSIDVPGQGVHYGNLSLLDGVFNPVRPEALVYKGGVLVAQLYYGEGDVIGWGPDRDHNVRAVNTDSLVCTPSNQEPPGTSCGWDGAFDGWHWHADLCTVGIGTSQARITRLPSQDDCAQFGANQNPTIICSFPPEPGFNCTWSPAVGWMSHLWNWLPNANYTNAVNPNANGQCTVAYCAVGESNGRFADCFPDVQGWNAYNCPQ